MKALKMWFQVDYISNYHKSKCNIDSYYKSLFQFLDSIMTTKKKNINGRVIDM